MSDDLPDAMEAELKASRALIRAVVVNRLAAADPGYPLYQKWAAASARCSLAIVARRTAETRAIDPAHPWPVSP